MYYFHNEEEDNTSVFNPFKDDKVKNAKISTSGDIPWEPSEFCDFPEPAMKSQTKKADSKILMKRQKGKVRAKKSRDRK